MLATDKTSGSVKSLAAQRPKFESENGSIASVDASVLPVMKRLSIRRLLLSPLGVREPHWHANAQELGYCLRGNALMTIADSHSVRHSFTVSPGEMFFVPSGALHHIENIGSDEAEFILAFSHEKPEDFGISGSFGAMTDSVLANTYNLKTEAFSQFKRSTKDTYIGSRSTKTVIEEQARHPDPLHYNLEATPAQITGEAGSAHTAKKELWPALKNVSMFSVRITDVGMREPHWHPETAEMGYIAGGRGRITILSPGGSTETFEISEGDTYFIPPAYPHHIENLGSDTLHLLIFFDQPTPGDVGFQTLPSCYSREVLEAAFGVSGSALPEFPLIPVDPLIVPRGNPISPPG
ncbi:cupin domain-containing protein [Hyphomicrobium sp.]|uniref:cupin domain-containing protein n=1 Tax=Hyphomicrobium sp. TaxID=82 RepID=UPI002D78A02B|nr:cupin domain-containing protein [Hyphomicrobium sp.]HET6389799.1 cupin domain-containing protein [Hyphomicrobium sp.]